MLSSVLEHIENFAIVRVKVFCVNKSLQIHLLAQSGIVLCDAVMKKKALSLILVFTMILVGVKATKVVEANFYPFGVPTLEKRSPYSAPYIYVTPKVDLSFDYNVQKNLTQVASFSYSLDNNANITLTREVTGLFSEYNRYSVFKPLGDLANGNHTLTVYAYFTNGTVSSIIDITITVDTAFVPPKPFIISPLNQTYNTDEVPLIYAIDSMIFHSYYSLDTANYGFGRVEFTGNTSLTNLSEGSHTLRLSLETESHSLLAYEYFFLTVYFTVDSNQSTPTPSPTPEPIVTPYGEADVQNTSQYLVAGGMVAVTVAVLAVGLGLLVYLIKRK